MATNPKAAAPAAVISMVIAFSTPFEGEAHVAYPDIARPEIWTICMGETKGVHKGMRMNHQQCVASMAKRVPDYLGPVDRMMPGLSDNSRIAYTDFAWNEGVARLTYRTGGRKGTSIVDLERAGRHPEACNRLLKFNTANRVVLPGLDHRRKAERELCLRT